MTPTTLMATAVLAEAWQSHLEEEAGGDHECVPEYCGEDVLRLARALPSDRRAALAAELLDVAMTPTLTPEAEAKIRQVAAEATDQAPAVVVLDPLSIRDLLAALDAARAENARLRLAIQVLTRLVREDYPTRSLVWIAHVWGSATDEELAALQTIEEGA